MQPLSECEIELNSFGSELMHWVSESRVDSGDVTGCFLLSPLAPPAMHLSRTCPWLMDTVVDPKDGSWKRRK